MFNLVEEAGFDVSDWIASSNDARGPKANPKYCYEWSFVQPGRIIILNLWFDQMDEEDGLIVQGREGNVLRTRQKTVGRLVNGGLGSRNVA